ncbi:hypothetical protein, partial [Corallococcus carmarthensis]
MNRDDEKERSVGVLPGGDDTTTFDGPPVIRAPAPRQASTPAFPVPGWDRYQCVRFLGQGGM